MLPLLTHPRADPPCFGSLETGRGHRDNRSPLDSVSLVHLHLWHVSRISIYPSSAKWDGDELYVMSSLQKRVVEPHG